MKSQLTAIDGLPTVLSRFGDLEAVVVGEAMLDVYRHGTAERLCPEGPFPVVDEQRRHAALGGAANVAANLSALGAKVKLISVVGEDQAAAELVELADQRGVDTSGVIRHPSRVTLVKERLVGEGRTLLRVDRGSTGPLSGSLERRLVGHLAEASAAVDLIVVSDYRYGVVGDSSIDWLVGVEGPRVVVDSKHLARFGAIPVDAITSNYREVVELLGEQPVSGSRRVDHLRGLAFGFAECTGAAVGAVTLDADGVVVFDRKGGAFHLPAVGSATDSCGAGDTFTAAMSLGLTAGMSPRDAVDLAGRAAAIVVGKAGTAVCSLDELRAADSKLRDLASLARSLAPRRAAGQTVVLTNGCFDVLHAGHVASLNEAAEMGDILVVALNDDESVRRLKGSDRPVNTLSDRVAVLEGLSAVDHIVTFHEDAPLRVLRALQPDVYCKGGDYRGRWIPEMELLAGWGGRFETTSYVADHSTTALVERVRGPGLAPMRAAE